MENIIKTCWHCKQDKTLSDFYKDRKRKDGYQGCCKECTKRFNKNFKSKHPEYFKDKGKELYGKMTPEEREEYNRERYKATSGRYKAYAFVRNQTAAGVLYNIWLGAQQRAKDFEREFTITREWVEQTLTEQGAKCALTGIPFEYKKHDAMRRNPWRPSLDRIDNAKGYTPENTRIVCLMVNLAMCDFGEDALIRIAESLLKNRKP